MPENLTKDEERIINGVSKEGDPGSWAERSAGQPQKNIRMGIRAKILNRLRNAGTIDDHDFITGINEPLDKRK